MYIRGAFSKKATRKKLTPYGKKLKKLKKEPFKLLKRKKMIFKKYKKKLHSILV